MNIFNVHINWFPVNGVIKYFKYHKGNFAAAYLPKSSTENERTTIVIECNNGKTVLMRQIAGAMAKPYCLLCSLSEDRPVRISTPVLSNSVRG